MLDYQIQNGTDQNVLVQIDWDFRSFFCQFQHMLAHTGCTQISSDLSEIPIRNPQSGFSLGSSRSDLDLGDSTCHQALGCVVGCHKESVWCERKPTTPNTFFITVLELQITSKTFKVSLIWTRGPSRSRHPPPHSGPNPLRTHYATSHSAPDKRPDSLAQLLRTRHAP